MADKSKQFPYEFFDLNEEESVAVARNFKGNIKEYVRVGPKGYFLPKGYIKYAASMYNMPVRPRDTFVMTFQRSGTTMTQELVWLVENDFDYDTAKSTLLTQRYYYLEMPMFNDDNALEVMEKRFEDTKNAKETMKDFDQLPLNVLPVTQGHNPHFTKSHLPLSLLPPKLLETAKVVYVARDPRDVCVSSYHMAKFFVDVQLQADFKEFWNLFKNGLFWFTPYFEHVKEAWTQRNHPNMLFLFYEDIRKDLPSNIRRIARFLGKEPTEEQISSLCDHLQIENFKNNPAVNYEEMRPAGKLSSNERFIRTGKTGGWRDYFDEQMTIEAENWIIENLRDTDLRFPSMRNMIIS